MTDPSVPSQRTSTTKPAPQGFAKGAGLGALVVIPLFSLGIFIANRMGLGDQRPSMIAIVRLTVVFAGLPVVVTCGGVGRLAAQGSRHGGRWRGAWIGGRSLAVAGIALIILAAVPTEVIPGSRAGWIALAVVGMMGGALIGLACSGELPTLSELGMWPADGTVGHAIDRVVNRAAGQRRGARTAPVEDPARPGDPADPPDRS